MVRDDQARDAVRETHGQLARPEAAPVLYVGARERIPTML